MARSVFKLLINFKYKSYIRLIIKARRSIIRRGLQYLSVDSRVFYLMLADFICVLGCKKRSTVEILMRRWTEFALLKWCGLMKLSLPAGDQRFVHITSIMSGQRAMTAGRT